MASRTPAGGAFEHREGLRSGSPQSGGRLVPAENRHLRVGWRQAPVPPARAGPCSAAVVPGAAGKQAVFLASVPVATSASLALIVPKHKVSLFSCFSHTRQCPHLRGQMGVDKTRQTSGSQWTAGSVSVGLCGEGRDRQVARLEGWDGSAPRPAGQALVGGPSENPTNPVFPRAGRDWGRVRTLSPGCCLRIRSGFVCVH